MIAKYIQIYAKRNIRVAFIVALMVAVPLFIVSLFADIIPYDYLISLAPFPIAVIVVLILLLPVFRFRRMIQAQERMYAATFHDTDAEHLETTLYLTKDWLIWAGVSAFHKKHIKTIQHRPRIGNAGGTSNEVRITTVDNKKYTIWCLSTSNVKLLKDWLKI